MFTSRGGGLGLGQHRRAGGRGGLGFEPGPKKLPHNIADFVQDMHFLLVK
jgi:hypothetical protein